MATIVQYNGRKVGNPWLKGIVALGAMGFCFGLVLFLILAVFPLAGIALTLSAGVASLVLSLLGFLLVLLAIALPVLILGGSLLGMCYAPIWLLKVLLRGLWR